jgi:hypothetical protein
VTRERLQLALELLPSAAWERFEHFASEFCSSVYGNLRTLAWPSGDRGRDAVIWQPEDDPTVVFQYSVIANWETKISTTARDLAEEFPNVQVLRFVSNRLIGPQADAVRERVRKAHKIYVDVLDQSWFLDRQNFSAQTAAAAEQLAENIVDAYLSQRVRGRAVALSSEEARAAVVYLTLQWEDEARERGLTKLCFEALVRAVLRDTSSSNPMPRSEIHRRIQEILPLHAAAELDAYTDLALTRLARAQVNHHLAHDEFCLSYEERRRLRTGLAELDRLEVAFTVLLKDSVESIASGLGVELPDDCSPIIERSIRVLERYLLERGEAFVQSVTSGEMLMVTAGEISELVISDLSQWTDDTGLRGHAVPVIQGAVSSALLSIRPEVQQYLRAVADGYTLFAFLKQTPNVQSAIVKMFSYGEFWLDTSVILPLLAETLLPEDERRYTVLFGAAREAGIHLSVTCGVVEELEHHITNSLTCKKMQYGWKSDPPFLFSAYLWSGADPAGFESWLSEFRGSERPTEDVAETLDDLFGVEVRDLHSEVAKADPMLRFAVEEYWRKIHEVRGDKVGRDPEVVRALADHDVENFLGIIVRRGSERASPFGYSSWWIAFDHAAFLAAAAIKESTGTNFQSPVLSLDFLTNYLAVGPLRRQVAKSTESRLPLMLDMSMAEAVPADLLEIAAKTRTDMAGQSERRIRRNIRDRLDREKLVLGAKAFADQSGPAQEVGRRLRETHRRGS